MTRPIQDLMKKNTKFVWGEEQRNAFEKLKRAITHPQVLAFFKNDCKTRIITDASPVGLGAVLTQFQDGCWRVISYASRSLTEVEKRYSQTEKEALGLYELAKDSIYMYLEKSLNWKRIIARCSTSTLANQNPQHVWKGGYFGYKHTILKLFTNLVEQILPMHYPD